MALDYELQSRKLLILFTSVRRWYLSRAMITPRPHQILDKLQLPGDYIHIIRLAPVFELRERVTDFNPNVIYVQKLQRILFFVWDFFN